MRGLSQNQKIFVAATARRIIPEIAELDRRQLDEFLNAVDAFLALRPAGIRRQFNLFLWLLRWVSAPVFWRPLEALPGRLQDRVLAVVQDSPVLLIRRGFWGLKTLVFLSYYQREETFCRIGYHPSVSGNDLLALRAGSVVRAGGQDLPCG